MLLISWNIDSLNAALTSDSARAQKTRHVLTQIAEKKPDILAIQETKLRATGPTKKHAEILAKLFLTMSMFGVHLKNPQEKVMLEPCICIKIPWNQW